jgi:hypothetical protein
MASGTSADELAYSFALTEQRHVPTQANVGVEWDTLLRARLASLGGADEASAPTRTGRLLEAEG